MTPTRAPTTMLHLGLAFAIAVGLLFMHGLMLPGSSMDGHHTSPDELTSRAPEAADVVQFAVIHESGSMHLVELCILLLATGFALAALARAAFGRCVGPQPGLLSVEAALIPHGPAPPRTPTHLELGIVLR